MPKEQRHAANYDLVSGESAEEARRKINTPYRRSRSRVPGPSGSQPPLGKSRGTQEASPEHHVSAGLQAPFLLGKLFLGESCIHARD